MRLEAPLPFALSGGGGARKGGGGWWREGMNNTQQCAIQRARAATVLSSARLAVVWDCLARPLWHGAWGRRQGHCGLTGSPARSVLLSSPSAGLAVPVTRDRSQPRVSTAAGDGRRDSPREGRARGEGVGVGGS